MRCDIEIVKLCLCCFYSRDIFVILPIFVSLFYGFDFNWTISLGKYSRWIRVCKYRRLTRKDSSLLLELPYSVKKKKELLKNGYLRPL